jgi:hypothetical protein
MKGKQILECGRIACQSGYFCQNYFIARARGEVQMHIRAIYLLKLEETSPSLSLSLSLSLSYIFISSYRVCYS